MKRLKLLLASFIITLGFANADAQVTVTATNNMSVATLVEKYLIGPNIEFINDASHPATFNGQTTVGSNALGIFTNLDTTGCNMPMDTGLVIVSGSCTDAAAGSYSGIESSAASPKRNGNNVEPDFYATYYKYYLESTGQAPNQQMNDVGTLSFWIKPKIENFAFSYAFASEEYCQYVNSNFNDFFGFYFSGPYDSLGNEVIGSTQYTMQNLALVPGTNTPVMINTVNHGPCSQPSAASYPEYHRTNCNNNCKMNAYTDRLSTALVNVQADKYYRIDIDICDIGDDAFNSALYISKDMRRFDTINIDTTICDDIEYYFEATGEYLTETGTYQCVKKNETGGDSIITVTLTVNETGYTVECWTLKEGEYKDMNGARIDAPGVWPTHLESENGCDSIVEFIVEWGDSTCKVGCSGLDELNLLNIVVYPNPANNEITLEGFDHDASIMFIDNSGRIAKEVTIPRSSTVDISDLRSGVYFLYITYDNQRIRKKLIVK